MSKTVKFIFLAILGVVVLAVVVPLLGGIIAGVNPNKAVQMAQQKTAENKEVYVPQGFTISKKAEPKESDYGTLYVTEMVNTGKKIEIIESSGNPVDCKGEVRDIDGIKVCYFGLGKLPAKPKSRLILWSMDNKDFQVETDAESLSDDELSKIVVSL